MLANVIAVLNANQLICWLLHGYCFDLGRNRFAIGKMSAIQRTGFVFTSHSQDNSLSFF